MVHTFRIDNLSDMEDAYSRTGCIAFSYYLQEEYNLPMYFYVEDGEIRGHQDIEDDGISWYSKEAEDYFNRAAPYKAFKHPEKYPEYYI